MSRNAYALFQSRPPFFQTLDPPLPPTWMLPTFDELIYLYIKNVYNFYCKWIHFIDKLETFVLPNSIYNIYKDDFVNGKYDFQSQNSKNAALIIVLPAPSSSSSVIFCQTPS